MPQIAVAGPSSTVTSAALAVADLGGSVVDAAVAAALTAMCTEPGVCGPGGGGFLTIDVPGHNPVVIDGYMSFPGKGFTGEPHVREVVMTYGGGVTTVVDAGSIAVPGAFSAFSKASEMFGLVPWRVLMETVAAVVDGFPLGYAAHHYLNEGAAPIYDSDPAARDALFSDGAPRGLGAKITFEGLSSTLERIGAEGAETFYGGDLGREIVDDLADRGGMLTLEDLRTYRAELRRPRTAMVGDWRVATNPAPAVGGQVLTDVLGGLERRSLAESLVSAFESRREAHVRSPSTISIAAADSEGGGVAASFSAGYGSGIIPKGTGMLMNNALGELELVSTASSEPGDRMISNMAPSVARTPQSMFAIGSPGADRITSAIATTLYRLAQGDSLEEAINHPRAHPEFGEFGVRLATEPGLDDFPSTVPTRDFSDRHMFFGGVNAAGLSDGIVQAFADPRRTGAIGFTDPTP